MKTKRITLFPINRGPLMNLPKFSPGFPAKKVVHQPVSFEEEKNFLVNAGVPEPFAEITATIMTRFPKEKRPKHQMICKN